MSEQDLFKLGDYTLNSGFKSNYKIDADALSDNSWECIAYLLSLRLPPFGDVEGVPRGGLKLARAMEKYRSSVLGNFPTLICDDVYTTGGSMARQRNNRDKVIGCVWVARTITFRWVTPLLLMTPYLLSRSLM